MSPKVKSWSASTRSSKPGFVDGDWGGRCGTADEGECGEERGQRENGGADKAHPSGAGHGFPSGWLWSVYVHKSRQATAGGAVVKGCKRPGLPHPLAPSPSHAGEGDRMGDGRGNWRGRGGCGVRAAGRSCSTWRLVRWRTRKPRRWRASSREASALAGAVDGTVDFDDERGLGAAEVRDEAETGYWRRNL